MMSSATGPFLPSLSVLATFLAVSVALNITPGPDMMFVIAHTVSGGVHAGHRAALGIATGSLIQAFLAIAGISALIAAYSGLLQAITYAGAGYLIWIGLKILRGPYISVGEGRHNSNADANPFGRGVLTNLLNIKVVLFYVTLLPLFVRDSAGPEWQQIFFYGLLFNALGTSVLLCVASGVDRAAYRARSQQRALAWLPRLAGAVLIFLALTVSYRQAM